MRRFILTLIIVAAVCGLLVAPAQATEQGLDTSLRPTAAAYQAIARAGYTFMGRYLEISPATAGKWGGKVYYLTTAELTYSRSAGVGIFCIFEWCSRRNLPDDFGQGYRDARIAQKALARLGLSPATTVVYFSLDRVPYATDRQIKDYFRGVNHVLRSSRYVGVYGSEHQCKLLLGARLVRYTWHARWMDHNPPYSASSWATLYQSTALVYPGGVPCDRNWSNAAVGVVK